MFSSLDLYCLWLLFTMQNQRDVGICSTRPKYFFNSNLAKFQLSITYCFVVSLKFYPEHGSITFIRRLNVILYWLVFAQYKYNSGYIFYIATTTNIILDKPNIMASYDLRRHVTWWRHQMETLSALLAICAGNSPVTGEFQEQRPVTRSCDVFFDLRLE